LRKEIEWLNPTALRHQKNYQIWHHRQTIVDKIGSPEGEQDFVAQMFALDQKNYHVWSYRQWLVKRFDLWDAGELEAIEEMLKTDVRNNSAWNHRWFIVFGRDPKTFEDKERVRREVEYVSNHLIFSIFLPNAQHRFSKNAIRLAPQNQSPWNYLRGLIRQAHGPAAISLASFMNFALEFASIDDPDNISSSHALDLLADIYANEENKNEEASKALDLLASRYDPIRENYWNYRKSLLGGKGVEATA
jgi:protein farnesyltransferase/geranylgeranyltransferase type-1 subunit alpha